MPKIEVVKDYLREFSNKNIETLVTLIDDELEYADWESKETGIASFRDSLELLFSAFNEIKVDTFNIAENDDVVFVDTNITAIGEEEQTLHVVYAFTFSNDKISKITAFLGK